MRWAREMTPDELRATLRALGLTQRALADRLGHAYSTVNHWATGHFQVPQHVVAYLECATKCRGLAAALKACESGCQLDLRSL